MVNDNNKIETKDLTVSNKPKNMDEIKSKEIEREADKIVTSLVTSSGSEAMAIEDKIANIGMKDQKRIASGVTLLQEKMGDVFNSENKNAVTENVTKNITELQTALAKINPKDIQKEARYRIIRMLPFFGNRVVNILKVSAQRRMTLQEVVDHLESSLSSGEVMLRQDNAQLKVMYEDIEEKQNVIESNAYFAEVIMQKLEESINQSEDEKKKTSLNNLLFRVSTRAQDLRAMENVHEQFFTSIEMTRSNNELLIATVQRMISMGMNVVYIALAINAALARQKKVLEAEKATKTFIGNMIVQNAEMINNHVKQIGDLYKEPVIAMDKMQQAVNLLKQSIDETNRMKIEGIAAAKENVVKIKVMTEDLRNKSEGLPDIEIDSIEASKMLQLTEGKK
jgi:uncharacterized protein YaaN involved in tellurite resistance